MHIKNGRSPPYRAPIGALSEAQRGKMAPMMGKIFAGTEVRFGGPVPEWASAGAKIAAENGEINGIYVPGKAWISDSSFVGTGLHEAVWHATWNWAKQSTPDLFKKMEEFAAKAPRWLREEVAGAYETDFDVSTDEIGAFLFENEFEEEFLEKLVQDKEASGWFDGVKNLFKKAFSKMRGKKPDGDAEWKEMTAHDAVRELMAEFLDEKELGGVLSKNESDITPAAQEAHGEAGERFSVTRQDVDVAVSVYKLAQKAWEDKDFKDKVVVPLSSRLFDRLKELYGTEFKEFVITADSVRHIRNHHGGEKTETPRGQKALTPREVATIPYLLNNFDSAELSPQHNDRRGNKAVEVRKRINGVSVICTIEKGAKQFLVTSWQIVKTKKPADAIDVPKNENSSSPGLNVRNDSAGFIEEVKKDLEEIKTYLNEEDEKTRNSQESYSRVRVFHGSPHRFAAEDGHPFGRFRDYKMGTGEGRQTFGWGHYLTESEQFAREYAEGGARYQDETFNKALFRETQNKAYEIMRPLLPPEDIEKRLASVHEAVLSKLGADEEKSGLTLLRQHGEIRLSNTTGLLCGLVVFF